MISGYDDVVEKIVMAGKEAAADEASVATVEEEEPARPAGKTERKTRSGERTQPLPPHGVILHNDDLNTCDFVIEVLQKIFRYELAKAKQLMLEAHEKGRSIVWSGQKEIAELKADQVRSCGPDPVMKHRGALSLRVTVEPLPG